MYQTASFSLIPYILSVCFYFAYDVCAFGHEDACTLLHAYGGQRTSSGVGPLPTFTLRPNRLLLLPLCIHQTRRPIIKGVSSFHLPSHCRNAGITDVHHHIGLVPWFPVLLVQVTKLVRQMLSLAEPSSPPSVLDYNIKKDAILWILGMYLWASGCSLGFVGVFLRMPDSFSF